MLDAINAKSPNLPRHPENPVGQTDRIKRTRKAYLADIRKAQKHTIDTLMSWPVTVQNGRLLTNSFYEFLVDLAQLTRLVEDISTILKQGNGPTAARQAAEAAYREGTAKAVENLSGLIQDNTRTVTARLADQQVLRRASLAGGRAFEQMEGFAEDTAADLSRVLFRAVQDGENPRQTAKTIRERFGVSKSRAERIARTEITGALRRGRWDEARDTADKFGSDVRLIHYSALIPGRTRRTHAARHGKIVTVEEQAEWYAQNGNAINCLCTATEVVVGDDGEPLFGKKVVERLKEARAKFVSTAPDPGSV